MDFTCMHLFEGFNGNIIFAGRDCRSKLLRGNTTFFQPFEHHMGLTKMPFIKDTSSNNNIYIYCYHIMVFAGSVAYERLREVLNQTSLLKGIKQASPVAQTSCLEFIYHSAVNNFAPKMLAYTYLGILCR